jgi:hypothetical protein
MGGRWSNLTGHELKIGENRWLWWGSVPTRKSKAWGIRKGGTLNVLGYFIGEAEYEMFTEQMKDSFDNGGAWLIAAGLYEEAK